MKLKGKLLTIALVPVFLLAIIECVYAGLQISKSIKKEITDSLKAAVYAEREAISSKDGNNFYLSEDDMLMNGDICVTDDTANADKIKAQSGIVLTVFYGDTRYMTSVTDASGARVLRTKAGEGVISKVLKGGEDYFPETTVDVVNIPHYVGYVPLYNDGEKDPVGMVFAGKSKAAVDEVIKSTILGMVLWTGILVVVAVVVVYLVACAISNRFAFGVNALGELADGNLLVDIDESIATKKDETGDIAKSVQNLKEKLTEVVSEIVEKSNCVNEYAAALGEETKETSGTIEQVEHAVNEIAEGATSQANDTTRATENVITMGNLVEQTNDNVEKLYAASDDMEASGKNAAGILDELKKVNEQAKASIDIIYEQTNTTNESAKKIGEAINLITSIAEETNLLSLNASIEAARAGEQGRGFAVVASQISKLAEQSNDSAKKIEEIISSLMADSAKAVDTMDEVNVIMKRQNEMVENVNEGFEEVMSGIEKSRANIEEISANMTDLNSTRENVVDVVSNLSAIAEENAASTEETSASTSVVSTTVQEMAANANQLKEIAEELQASVAVFKF